MSKEGLIWEGVRGVVLYLKVDSGLGLEAGGTALARALFHRVRDAEGGAEGAGTALSPRRGRRDCRSDSGARSSPTPGGPAERSGAERSGGRPTGRRPAGGHALKN
ncbi:MAG: hypothetical protein N2050_11050 [Flavobacteriales bacterium]|nr:hypothetical protein [Flavobacteriales bacterium]